MNILGFGFIKNQTMAQCALEQIGNIWVVHYNGKTFESFASEAGAQAFLELLQTPITDDGD